VGKVCDTLNESVNQIENGFVVGLKQIVRTNRLTKMN